jgi:hypothetical protein
MRVALSSFLKYYEMAPIEKELEDSKDVRLYITLGVKKNSFKVRVKHRK